MKRYNEIEQLETIIGLRLAGISMADVGRDLGVTAQHVKNVIAGQTKSTRVAKYLNEKAKRIKIVVID